LSTVLVEGYFHYYFTMLATSIAPLVGDLTLPQSHRGLLEIMAPITLLANNVMACHIVLGVRMHALRTTHMFDLTSTAPMHLTDTHFEFKSIPEVSPVLTIDRQSRINCEIEEVS